MLHEHRQAIDTQKNNDRENLNEEINLVRHDLFPTRIRDLDCPIDSRLAIMPVAKRELPRPPLGCGDRSGQPR